MSDRLNIVLVEKAYLLSAGFENLLSEFPGLFLVAHYDGTENNLAAKIAHHKPDMVVIDPQCFNEGLFSLLNRLQLSNNTIIIGLITNSTPDNIKSHFRYCLNIEYGKHEVLESFKSFLGDKSYKKESDKSASTLSDRENTIVKQLVSGYTNQQIADQLFLSIHTVNTHRKNITNKLGIKTVSGLTVYAIMNKIVDIHDIEHK